MLIDVGLFYYFLLLLLREKCISGSSFQMFLPTKKCEEARREIYRYAQKQDAQEEEGKRVEWI